MFGQGGPFAAASAGVRRARPVVAALHVAVFLCVVSGVRAAEPTPIQDDANLYDVQFVGGETGWAVGDLGVVWKTSDGGATWRLLETPVECALRSVCFLTDRVGWIVGGGTTPYTRIGYGVVLFTSDGGTTWTVLAGERGDNRTRGSRVPQSPPVATGGTDGAPPVGFVGPLTLDPSKSLPQLHVVKFFGLQEGVLVGETSADHPTGVFVTKDGGQSWQDVSGSQAPGWRAADFLAPDRGIVAGLQGRLSLVSGDRLLRPRVEPLGLRGLRCVKLDRSENGWLVGDGGLALRTDNGGVSLQPPQTPLPNELRDFVAFHTVEVRGSQVWIAGEPGSVIWHSPDTGLSWTKQFTGQPLPIEGLEFISDTVGWAAGALGTLLHTEDGGNTWTAVRGGDRRIALMSINARPTRVSFPLLVTLSGDLGYRSLVLLPVRRDLGPNGSRDGELDVRLQEAAVAAGGSSGEVGWQLPITIPGLEHSTKELVADWNRQTEGRLREVFLGMLVARLRTWRPDVVVIDKPGTDDAVTTLLNEAVLQAVDQAADPTRFLRQRELAGLQPWTVSKVYQRLPPGSTGDAHVDRYQYLPRLETSVLTASEGARTKLTGTPAEDDMQDAFRLVVDHTRDDPQHPPNYDFFLGIPLAPGSEARRVLLPYDEDKYETQLQIARKQRNLLAYAERYLDDPRHAGQLIAHVKQMTADMDDEQAVLQLVRLAQQYRKHARWELAEATLIELVEQHPHHPAAHDAMRWLFQWWSGAEPAWQRVKDRGVNQQRFVTNPESVLTRLNEALKQAQASSHKPSAASQSGVSPQGALPIAGAEPDPWDLADQSGRLQVDAQTDWRTGTLLHRQEQALRMASLIRRTAPVLFRSPDVQFPLAALLRGRGSARLADGFYRNFEQAPEDDPWRQTAATELWLSSRLNVPPKKIAACRFTAQPPVLDAVLSDPCWQTAEEIRLHRSGSPNDGESRGEGDSPALVLLAYGADYLYLAASVPRVPGTRDDRPVLAGRTHDADLINFDRLSVYLDVDRDYATYYAFHVDQRGFTAESCWGDTSWNPQWYVAADGDETHWRIEAAIPLSELVPHPPAKRSLWAVGIVRTIPSVGLESWTQPAAERPRPETFGLLRFD